MRYVCVHCEHRWEVGGADAPRRCPSCMRATGVQPVRDEPEPKRPARRSSRALVGLVALSLLAAVGGYFAWGRRPSAGESASAAPLSSIALQEALGKAQVDAGELAQLLASDPSIELFAKRAAGDADRPDQKAEAVTRALRARASALAFVPWSLGEPRTTPIGTAKQVLSILGKDRGRAELYPLELAAVAVAALRSLGVAAMVAELMSVEGERAPLDPSGYLGYFVVAVYAGQAALGPPRLFDPYGGRALEASAKHAVLRDPQAVGAALSVRALHEIAYLADPRRALDSSSHALSLAATLPSVRTVRGMVVLAGRLVEQALQEFAAARQLRGDPPRQHNLANVELATGDVEQATKELNAALERMPDFASAHATLGSLFSVRGELEQARAELEQAQKLAPDLSLVDWAFAEYWLRAGEREQALASARRALAARPSFDARLRMGALLRELAHYDDLRKVASELSAMAPAYRKSEVEELIRTVLGPAALDGADSQALGAGDVAPDPQLDLRAGSKLLAKPGDVPGAPAPPKSGEDAPRLRLRNDSERLRLNLNPP